MMSRTLLLSLLVMWFGCRAEPRAALIPSSVPAQTQPRASEPSTLPKPQKEIASLWVYVGSYEGVISQYELSLQTGALIERSRLSGLRRPSALAVHPSHRYLYAVDDTGQGGVVRAFAIEPSAGALKLLSTRSSGGAGPTHLSVDKSGRFLLVANYNSGSVAVLQIKDDGSLGETTSFIEQSGHSVNTKRQRSPHAHQIIADPENRFVLVPDLGTDELLVYQFDSNSGGLSAETSVAAQPGSGPRHLAFHPGGHIVYLLHELQSTITTFSYREGALSEHGTFSALPSSRFGCCAAEIAVHPSGAFLYSSQRGHDSLAMFSIDQETGELRLLGHQQSGGKTPRNFIIEPTGRYLLVTNQGSGSLVVFAIDSKTGLLTMSKEEPLKIPGAAGLVIVPVP